MKVARNRIYLRHYGYTYSLTKEQAKKLCERAIKGNGWDIGIGREIKRPKSWYYVYDCLDYDTRDWVALLDFINELINKGRIDNESHE